MSDASRKAPTTPPGTLRLGSVGGVPLYVNQSWLIVAALLTITYAGGVERAVPGLGGVRYLAAFAFVMLFFASLLAHEVAHALVGQRLGRTVRSITLHFFGGATAFEGTAKRPGEDFWMSVVGPVTTLAIAAASYAVSLTLPADGLPHYLFNTLALLNLLLGVFNLLPGLPLDGGHMLAAGVWKVTGTRERGLVVAARGGQVLAVLVLGWPFAAQALLGWRAGVTDFVIAAMMAAFLWLGAQGSLRFAELQGRLPALQGRALARRALVVPADLSVAEAVRRARESGAGAVVTHLGDDRIDGIVDERALLALPEERRPWVPVSTLTRAVQDGMVMPADIGGQALVEAMTTSPAGEYLLVEVDGSLFGVLAAADVEAAFARAR